MSNGDWLFIPTASPNSAYIVQAPTSGDPNNALVLPTQVIMAGPHAYRPVATANYNGCLYLETDTNGGTLFRCDGTEWVQTGVGVTGSAFPTGSAGGDLGGSYPNPTVQQAAGAFALPGVLTPSIFTTDQNDYNPTGLATTAVLRLSATAAVNLTGLAGGAAGRVIIILNVGSYDITLLSSSGASLPANQFAFAADVALATSEAAMLQYDAVASAWTLVAISATSGSVNPASFILAGTHASRPAASSGYTGYLYLETDTGGGTLFRCDGTTWVQTALGVTAEAASAAGAPPTGSAGGALSGTYPDPTLEPAVILPASDANAPSALVLGSSVIMAGTHASRPSPSVAGLLYLETDTEGGTLFRDTGSAWVQAGAGVNPSGTIRTTYASRPAAGTAGHLWLASDSIFSAYDDGTEWHEYAYGQNVTPSGGPTTWGNQLTGATFDTTKGGIYLSTPASSGTLSLSTLVKNLPSPPYTITVGIVPNMPPVNNGVPQTWSAFLALYDSVSGKYQVFGLEGWGNNGRPCIEVVNFANATSSPSGSAYNGERIWNPTGPVCWLQVTDDGTNRTYYTSQDGVHFLQFDVPNANTNYLTPNMVGIAVNELMYDTTNPPPVAAWMVSWSGA